MGDTILSNVETPEGETVSVMTKGRFLFIFPLPHTSVMPLRTTELGSRGVQFQWTTNDRVSLKHLHNLVLETLRLMGLTELRGVADLAKHLVALGVPFAAEDAPLPDSLKQLSPYVKRLV